MPRMERFLAALLLTCVAAKADVNWTLQNLDFTNGNAASGWFVTNDAATLFKSFSVTVTGPSLAADFTAVTAVSTYLPGEIGFASSGFLAYMDLFPGAPLTAAGGAIQLTGQDMWGDKYGVDCPGCGVLLPGNNPQVIGVHVPEPTSSQASLVCIGAAVLILLCRRRRAWSA